MVSELEVKAWIREIIREELSQLKESIRPVTPPSDDAPLMTRAEVAQYLRISLVTLTSWVRRGLPAQRNLEGGRVLFIKSDVLQWLKNNQKAKGFKSVK